MLPLSSTPDTASRVFRTKAPWNVIRLEMSPPPCRSVRTFTVNSRRLSIFTPPRPTYRRPFTEPLDGFRKPFGQSSVFTSYSRAPESTVISRYRPRLPSVSTGSLSIDLLLVVTVDRSTSLGHYSHSEQIQSKLRQVDHLLHWICHTPFFRTSGAERTFFWCPASRSQRG